MISPKKPTIIMATALEKKATIIKSPFAEEGLPFAFSWIIASITGVTAIIVNPDTASIIIWISPDVYINRISAKGAIKRAQNKTFLLPIKSLKVPERRTPAIPNVS